MAVTLQDGNDWADHAALYDYGFSTYPAKLGASLGQTIQRVQVENGMSATVPLVAADSFAWPLAEGESLELDVELAGSLRAPSGPAGGPGEAVSRSMERGGPGGAAVWRRRGAPDGSALSILKQGCRDREDNMEERLQKLLSAAGVCSPADGRDIFDRRKGDGERPDRPSGPACRPGSGRIWWTAVPWRPGRRPCTSC